MNDYLTMLVITAVTGVGGLALGGALATALHSPSDRSISLLLRFTAGVILSLVCFDLIADAGTGRHCASDLLDHDRLPVHLSSQLLD